MIDRKKLFRDLHDVNPTNAREVCERAAEEIEDLEEALEQNRLYAQRFRDEKMEAEAKQGKQYDEYVKEAKRATQYWRERNEAREEAAKYRRQTETMAGELAAVREERAKLLAREQELQYRLGIARSV